MTVNLKLALTQGNPIQTISSVEQEAVEVEIPPAAKNITVGSRSAALYVSFIGTEGQLLSETTSAFTVANNYLSMKIPNGINSFFVSTIADTTATVVIILE